MNKSLMKAGQKIEDKLDTIILSEDEIQEISNKETSRTLFSAILESIGLGGVVKVLETSEKIEEKINDRKKSYLMASYFSEVDNIEEEILKLKKFVSDPAGNTLFNKIVRIVNANHPNKEYITLLSKVLKRITNSDFQKLFSKHIYALNQIEKLTPQALIVLADFENWPEYTIGNYASRGGIISTEWTENFSEFYTHYKGITDDDIKRRIAHSIKELLRNDLIMSYIQGERDSKELSSVKESSSKANCDFTDLGKEIIEYIDAKDE